MTSVFQARRRAEEFATAVDGASPRAPDHSDEVAHLVEVVATLRSHERAEPRAEFAADLRSRLMVEAEASLDPTRARLLLPVPERSRRERRLVAAASALVLIGGSATMAAASQSALPGEALYPIKRGIESAEVRLSLSAAGKGQDLLRQATDRLEEVRGLVSTDRTRPAPQVAPTLGDFSEAAQEGATLLLDSFREDADPDHVVSVRTFAAEGIATLTDLADSVPAEAQADLSAAAILLRDIDQEAADLCGTCAPDLPEVEVPGIFLARAEVDRALRLADSRELQNSHPVVVPKDSVEQVRRPGRAANGTEANGTAGSATATQPDASTTRETAPPATGTQLSPSPALEPDSSWPSLLPGIGSSGGGPDKESGSGAGPRSGAGGGSPLDGAGKDLDTGLTGAVETLLPDPDPETDAGGDLGLLD